MFSTLRGMTVLLLLSGLLGCAGNHSGPSNTWSQHPYDPGRLDLPTAPATVCPGDERPRSDASFRLALPGTVSPSHAPLPDTEAERHVFRNLYETLVRVDCDGRLRPQLARSWQAYDGGRVWVLRLRDDAEFWDGSPVTAGDVVSAWRWAKTLCRLRGEPSPFLYFDPSGASLQILGTRELAIRLRTPSDRLPLMLAHPALAITGVPDASGWPLGSGPCRPGGDSDDRTLVLQRNADHPEAPIWRRIEILLGDGLDAREHLDRGVDALVTREHAVVSYYAGRRGTQLEPLPWDRCYYLVTPTETAGSDPADRRRWTGGWDRIELAHEVAAQTAEPAEFFAVPPQGGVCPALPPNVATLERVSLAGLAARASRDTDLVLWPADDPEAGRLADRLAVTAARPLRPATELPGRTPLTRPIAPPPGVAPEAVAVSSRDLDAHIQAGRAGAIVLPWPRRFPTACGELARLLSLAGWIQDSGFTPGPDTGTVPPGATAAHSMDHAAPDRTLAVARRLERDHAVQPLVRTRAHLIRTPGLVGIRCAYDGTLQLWTGGWRSDPDR